MRPNSAQRASVGTALPGFSSPCRSNAALMLRNRSSLGTYLLSGTAPDLNEFENGRRLFLAQAKEVIDDPISDEQKVGVNAAVEADRALGEMSTPAR